MADRAYWDRPQPVEIMEPEPRLTIGYALSFIALFGLVTAIWAWQKLTDKRGGEIATR